MTIGAVTPRLSAYDDASRSALDAAGNAADYLRRVRTLRQREAVAQVHAELRRRVPTRARGRFDALALAWAVLALVVSALALIVSVGLFL